MPRVEREKWLIVSEHLDRVLELAAAQREQYLAQLESTDLAMAVELRNFLGLQRSDAYREFLSGSAPNTASWCDSATLAGQTLGPYIIEAEIGRGGMGSVWRARRADGRFEGVVAVKLLNAAFVGQPAEQRFRREGSLLADLRHPHIAQLLDAGVAPTGQAYLVLEYIEGLRIDRYCTDREMSVPQRIRLFLDVIAAVSHAHSHLVVHRDIKPENILVTSAGAVKLLDFGVAALLGSEAGIATIARTQEANAAFTPAYATPEQLLNAPITTANDVYALGLVLFVLLAEKHPFALQRDSAAERVKAVTERDAPTLSGAAGMPALARQLRGDLDNIVGKALQRVPGERYATVEAFGADLRRYLNLEPVQARPATLVYRTAKFVARHRGGVLTAILSLLAISMLSIVAWLQRNEALRQAQRARAEASKAAFVKDFLLDIFNANSLQQSDPQKAQNTTALQLLDRAAQRLQSVRSMDPATDDELLNTIGWLYQDMHVVDTAVKLRKRRLDVARYSFPPDDVRIVDALINYGTVLYDSRGWKQAIAPLTEADAILYRRGDVSSINRAKLDATLADYWRATDVKKSLNLAERSVNLFHDRYPDSPDYVMALRSAGYSAANAFHKKAEEGYFRLAVQTQQRLGLAESDSIQSIIMLAEAQRDLWMNSEAERNFLKGVEMSRRIDGLDHIDTFQAQLRYAAFLRLTARYPESIALLRITAQRAVSALGEQESFHLPTIRYELAFALMRWGDEPGAAPILQQALQVREKTRPDSLQFANFLGVLAAEQTQRGQFGAASATLDRMEVIYRHIGLAAMKTFLPLGRAQNFLAQSDWRSALQVLDANADAVGAEQLHDPEAWVERARAQQLALARARVWLQSGEYARAESVLQKLAAEPVTADQAPYFSANNNERELLLGELYAATQRAAAALPLLHAALAWRRTHLNPVGPQVLEAIVALADVAIAEKDAPEARRLLNEADRIARKQPQLGPQFIHPLHEAHRQMHAVPAA